jgi:DNA transformation protein
MPRARRASKPRPPALSEAVFALSPLGDIALRPMFGGYALYLDGVLFALFFADRLYFKVDDGNRPDFRKAGMGPFEYETDGGTQALVSYWEVPPAVRRSGPRFRDWASKARDASRRLNAPKARR